MHRAGLYAWGGPGTLRLLNAKYHSPRVDEASFLTLYDEPFLADAQRKLGITDMWVTYSWGFADTTEQVDRDFIVTRLPNFAAYNIAAYAYVQGLNVVTSEFEGQDIFCCDAQGQRLSYSRGRTLTCPNKPAARQIILDRVRAASQESFAGVYIDNVLFGLPPFFVRRDYTSFFGCACDDCQRAFQAQYGYPLPVTGVEHESVLADYLSFREQTIYNLLKELSDAARAAGKRFGINLYDPFWFFPPLHYGFRLAQVKPLLDYYVIENHGLGYDSDINNTHLLPLLQEETDKPVFVISYRRGIGFDAAFTQGDIDLIWSDAQALGYSPCLKATEFLTHGVWHALDLTHIDQPNIRVLEASRNGWKKTRMLRPSNTAERQIVRMAGRYYAPMVRMSFENRWLADFLGRSRIITALYRKSRWYDVEGPLLRFS